MKHKPAPAPAPDPAPARARARAPAPVHAPAPSNLLRIPSGHKSPAPGRGQAGYEGVEVKGLEAGCRWGKEGGRLCQGGRREGVSVRGDIEKAGYV